MNRETRNFWIDMFPENSGKPIFSTSEGVLEINILSEIGGDFWGNVGVTKDSFLEAITAGKESEKIVVNVSSLGGDVDTALYINSLLNKYRDKVTVYFSGIVASAATWIGTETKRIASESTVFMMHESASMAAGTKREMQAAGQMLEIIDSTIFGLYSAMTGKPVEYFQNAINENGGELWLTATQALEIGLISEIENFAGATDIQPIPAQTAQKFSIQNSKYIMQSDKEKSILGKIRDLVLGYPETAKPENLLDPAEREELDAIIAELRSKVDETQAVIEKFTATQSENEATIEAQTATIEEQKAEIENLKKQVTAVNIKPTVPANQESGLSEAAQKLVNKYLKHINK